MADVLTEIAASMATGIQPDEFTVADLARQAGVSLASASSKLSRLKTSGELVVRKISLNGTMTNVYRRA